VNNKDRLVLVRRQKQRNSLRRSHSVVSFPARFCLHPTGLPYGVPATACASAQVARGSISGVFVGSICQTEEAHDAVVAAFLQPSLRAPKRSCTAAPASGQPADDYVSGQIQLFQVFDPDLTSRSSRDRRQLCCDSSRSATSPAVSFCSSIAVRRRFP
jgi:hypothetical protein